MNHGNQFDSTGMHEDDMPDLDAPALTPRVTLLERANWAMDAFSDFMERAEAAQGCDTGEAFEMLERLASVVRDVVKLQDPVPAQGCVAFEPGWFLIDDPIVVGHRHDGPFDDDSQAEKHIDSCPSCMRELEIDIGWDGLVQEANEAAADSRTPGAPRLKPGSSREQLLRWLAWNDPNGCYTDEQCIGQDSESPVLTTRCAAICMIANIVAENTQTATPETAP